MNSYRLFASTYESVEIMFASKTRDEALEVHNNSILVTVQEDTIDDALGKFTSSVEFTEFIYGKSQVYYYYLDKFGKPNSISEIKESNFLTEHHG